MRCTVADTGPAGPRPPGRRSPDRPPVDPSSRAAASRDRGQAAVEFAAALGLIAVLVVTIARVGVVIRDELAVGLAAREGARAAAVAANPSGAASTAAQRVVRLPISVATSVGSSTVTVTVTYNDDGGRSLLSRMLGAVTHRSSATMALEPP